MSLKVKSKNKQSELLTKSDIGYKEIKSGGITIRKNLFSYDIYIQIAVTNLPANQDNIIGQFPEGEGIVGNTYYVGAILTEAWRPSSTTCMLSIDESRNLICRVSANVSSGIILARISDIRLAG